MVSMRCRGLQRELASDDRVDSWRGASSVDVRRFCQEWEGLAVLVDEKADCQGRSRGSILIAPHLPPGGGFRLSQLR